MIRRPPRSTLFPYTTLFRSPMTGDWKEKVRGRIRRADLVVVICGEYTHTATGVAAELSIARELDRKSTRLNSSHDQISYAVFCLKKKINTTSVLPSCNDRRL